MTTKRYLQYDILYYAHTHTHINAYRLVNIIIAHDKYTYIKIYEILVSLCTHKHVFMHLYGLLLNLTV